MIVPFSASTLGVRIGALAYNLAEGMTALLRGTPLPSIEFSKVSVTSPGRRKLSTGGILGKSGVRVYDILPTVDGIDLNEFCPGSSATIRILDEVPQNKVSGKSGYSDIAIGLGVTLGTACVLLIFVAVIYAKKNKKMQAELDGIMAKDEAIAA